MHFYKYQGTGNDFVLIDNRETNRSDLPVATIKDICNRRFGVGADGFMALNNKEEYDFEMLYYNADGRPGSMCGNGGRCIARFAYDIGIIKNNYHFLAPDGEHEAFINEDGTISLKMRDVIAVQKNKDHFILNTGSPHYVKEVFNIEKFDVVGEGRKIRNSDHFKQDGINVNFVEPVSNDTLKVRTYERGVEDETFSCGTGVTAAAIAFYHNENGFNSINIEARGGNLNVSFERNTDNNTYKNIWLNGPAEKVYEGDIVI